MSVELIVNSSEFRGQALQDLTEDLCQSLIRDAKVDAAIKTGKGSVGERVSQLPLELLSCH